MNKTITRTIVTYGYETIVRDKSGEWVAGPAHWSTSKELSKREIDRVKLEARENGIDLLLPSNTPKVKKETIYGMGIEDFIKNAHEIN